MEINNSTFSGQPSSSAPEAEWEAITCAFWTLSRFHFPVNWTGWLVIRRRQKLNQNK